MTKGQLSLLECYNLLGLESNLNYSFENLVGMLNLDPNALKYIPKEYQTKKIFKNTNVYSLPFAHIKKSLLDENQVLHFIKLNGSNYKHLSSQQKKNSLFILTALGIDGNMLSEIPESVIQTPEMVEIAFNQTKKCFYAIKAQNLTQTILNQYIEACPDDFSWVLYNSSIFDDFKKNQEFIRLAIIGSSSNISHVEQSIDLCILSLEHHKDSYEYITLVDNPTWEITLRNLYNKKKLDSLISL